MRKATHVLVIAEAGVNHNGELDMAKRLVDVAAEAGAALLKSTNRAGVMTRPVWTLMTRLPLYTNALRGPLDNAEWLEARVVNLPSSVLPAGC